MGLFSVSLRRSSQESQKEATPRTPHKPHLSSRIRSVLSSRASVSSKDSPRVSSSAGPLKRTTSLTVIVPPTSVKTVHTLPCRFVASATKLGSGAYGAVLLGTDLVTHDKVAIKFIPEGRMRESSLEREVAMLMRLSKANHPALCKFHAHVRPNNVQAGEVRAESTLPLSKPYTTCHALVMEAVRGGELFDYVVKREGLGESETAPLFAQICDAVHAAHGLGIAHRDLKLENVLLVRKKHASASAGASGAKIKLIDWGLAHQHTMAPDGTALPEKLHSRCGSRSYMAPEVSNREISGVIGYDGFAADVWSLGVCLFAMHLAFFPFEQANPELDWRARRVVEAQRAGKSTMRTILSFYPQKAAGSLSDGLIALLDRMLVFNPKQRAGLAEVLCSEWLAPHVPAAWAARSIAKSLSIAHVATRTSSTISFSSEGSLTPRGLDEPPTYATARGAGHSRAPSNGIERADSSGTVQTASSAASVTPARAALAQATLPPHLPPPPPSPLQDTAVQVVVAGGSGKAFVLERQANVAKQPRPPELPKTPEAAGALAGLEIAEMLSKAVKLSSGGSPRRPDRNLFQDMNQDSPPGAASQHLVM